jgi:hypothetical protein
MDSITWLSTPNKNYKDGPPIVRFAELIAVNGGTSHVTGFGITDFGDMPYGRKGLEAPEALELIFLDGFVSGMSTAEDGRNKEQIEAMIANEIDRVIAEYNADKYYHGGIDDGTRAEPGDVPAGNTE